MSSVLNKMKEAEKKNKENEEKESFKSGAIEKLKELKEEKPTRGRKKRKDGINRTYYLDKEIVAHIGEESDEMGVSDSVFLEMLVRNYMKKKK